MCDRYRPRCHEQRGLSQFVITIPHRNSKDMLANLQSISEGVTLEEITTRQAKARFAEACESLLGITVEEFEDRLRRYDYSRLDRSAVVRVAMIRPSQSLERNIPSPTR